MMTAETAIRLNRAGYAQPKYKKYKNGQQFWASNGQPLVYSCREFIEVNTSRVYSEDLGIAFYYDPPVEELLQHPFFKYSSVSFDANRKQWQLKMFESQRENRYDYSDNLAELIGTLLAEHLEKLQNETPKQWAENNLIISNDENVNSLFEMQGIPDFSAEHLEKNNANPK